MLQWAVGGGSCYYTESSEMRSLLFSTFQLRSKESEGGNYANYLKESSIKLKKVQVRRPWELLSLLEAQKGNPHDWCVAGAVRMWRVV